MRLRVTLRLVLVAALAAALAPQSGTRRPSPRADGARKQADRPTRADGAKKQADRPPRQADRPPSAPPPARASGGEARPARRPVAKPAAKAKQAWRPSSVDGAWWPGVEPIVLHECADLVIVDKPAGWLTHADGTSTQRPSLVEWLASYLGTSTSEIGVHQRLDVDCSGVCCFGKSALGNKVLSDAFQDRHSIKKYIAIVSEPLDGAEGDEPVQPSLLMEAGVLTSAIDGSDALTRYKVLQRLPGLAVVECAPETGRRHQIRIHLARELAPLVGDGRYGCGIDRTAARALLHCRSVSLADGRTFTAPIPADMASAKPAVGEAFVFTDLRRGCRDDASTTAFRELNGAGDGYPANLFIDRYGSHLLVQRPVDVAESNRDFALDCIDRAHGSDSEASVYEIVTNVDRSHGGQPMPKLLRGPGAPAEGFAVFEHGTAYHVSLSEKKLSTGLWLDARPQRLWMRQFAKDLTVLNTFAHAGGYSVAAATAGAKRTVSVDISAAWLAYQKESLQHNGVVNAADANDSMKRPPHDVIFGDVFEWLQRFKHRNETFDVVILDPPSTSTCKGKRWSAARDYATLAKMALPLVKPGGALWATTNSRALLPRQFAHQMQRALGTCATLERAAPPAVDHPVAAGRSAPVKHLVFRLSDTIARDE
ncbi:S-adenosyl-L-methionine-dependent methyltransferase [Pelagophyceae sp. CCMP2097]|nr:S-adenosyl-L-methionine-dependent methyltransferase [Pelagophyceae sp. CCMP2097]